MDIGLAVIHGNPGWELVPTRVRIRAVGTSPAREKVSTVGSPQGAGNPPRLVEKQGASFIKAAITRKNFRQVLKPLLTSGTGPAFIVNLSVDVASLDNGGELLSGFPYSGGSPAWLDGPRMAALGVHSNAAAQMACAA